MLSQKQFLCDRSINPIIPATHLSNTATVYPALLQTKFRKNPQREQLFLSMDSPYGTQTAFIIRLLQSLITRYSLFQANEVKNWSAGALPPHPLSLTRVKKAIKPGLSAFFPIHQRNSERYFWT
jgi:hypothetical protein